MATKKEEKQFEKEEKAARKARKKRMKEEGIEKYLTPDQIRYNRNKAIIGAVWPVFRFLILFGLCFVILYPLIFMISTAFRPNEQMNDPSVVWLPKSLTWDNIEQTAKVMKVSYWDWNNILGNTVVNTIVMNVIASVLQVITCSITGYGFARFKFKFKGLLFAIVVLMIIVPPQIITIPLFMQFRNFGINGIWTTSLIDTAWTMYLPALFANGLRAGLFIFIFRQFFRGLPYPARVCEDADTRAPRSHRATRKANRKGGSRERRRCRSGNERGALPARKNEQGGGLICANVKGC